MVLILLLFLTAVCGTVFPREAGWILGRRVYFYCFNNGTTSFLTPVSVYVPRWSDGSPAGNPILARQPGDAGYTDLALVYNVTVNASYVPNTFKSASDVIGSGIALSQPIQHNWPVVPANSTLENPNDAKLQTGWYQNQTVYYFDFGASDNSTNNFYDFGLATQDPILSSIPGDAGYSAFWDVQVPNFNLTFGKEILNGSYVGNSIKNASQLNQGDWLASQIRNCPVMEVANTTDLPQVFPIIHGWYKDEAVLYYNFGANSLAVAGGAAVATAPIYTFRQSGNLANPQLGRNVIDVIPGDSGYTDLWALTVVNVDANYVPNTLTAVNSILSSGYQIQSGGILVNCPVVSQGSTLEGALGGNQVYGWYKNKTVFYYDYGASPSITVPIWVLHNNGSQFGNNVINSIPSDAGYSAFWQVNLYTVTAADNYVANTIQNSYDLSLRFPFVAQDLVVNCPVVQAAPVIDVQYSRSQGFYHNVSVYYYSFTGFPTQSTVFSMPAYILVFANGSLVGGQQPIVEYAPSNTGYSDLWEIVYVNVSNQYVPNAFTSIVNLTGLNQTSTGTYRNSPQVESGHLELPTDATLEAAWLSGSEVWYYDFGSVTNTTQNAYLLTYANGTTVASNTTFVIEAIPGDAGYSPFLLIHTPKSGSPTAAAIENGTLLPQTLTTISQLVSADWQPISRIANSPFSEVANSTELPQYFPLIDGWYKDQDVRYYNFFANTPLNGTGVGTAPIYVMMGPNGKTGNNIIGVVPGDSGYSDLWHVQFVSVPFAYVPNTLRSVQSVLASGYSITSGPFVNCPWVPQGSWIERAGDANPTFGWYKNRTVFYYDFGGSPDLNIPIWVLMLNGAQLGNNVINAVPSDAGYSAFWRVNSHTLTTADNYTANSIRNSTALEARFTFTLQTTIVNCPVVIYPAPAPTNVTNDTDVYFTTDIYPILMNVAAGGHGYEPGSAGFSLGATAMDAYKALVRQNATEVPGLYRINPFDANSSYLYLKITNQQTRYGGSGGDQMPLGGPYLSTSTIDLFSKWINQGAIYGPTIPDNNSTTPPATDANVLPFKGQNLTFGFCQFGFWTQNGNNWDICWNLTTTSITIAVRANTNGWMGYGFSKGGDTPMIGSTVVAGWDGSVSNTYVNTYYLASQSDATQNQPNGNLSLIGNPEVENLNGLTTILFTRPLDVAPYDAITPSTSVPVVWATGVLPSSEPYLAYHGMGDRSYGSVNFYTGAISVNGGNKYLTVHAVLMGLAWGFFLPIGIIFARNGKKLSWWIHVHRGIQLFGLTLVTISFIIAWVKVSTGTTGGLYDVHRAMGITIFVLGWFNPINAIFRPHPTPPTSGRFWWVKLHSWIGRTAVILAYVQIAVGLTLVSASHAYVTLYVVFVALMLAAYAAINWYTEFTNLTPPGKTMETPEREPVPMQSHEDE